MNIPTSAERIEGCLLGLLVGDAMGAPLRSIKAGHILQIYGQIDGYIDADVLFHDRPGRWMPSELHSNASQFALLFIEALLTSDHPAEEFSSLIQRFLHASDSPYGLFRGLSTELRKQLKTGESAGCHEGTAVLALVPQAIDSFIQDSSIPPDSIIKSCSLLQPDFRVITSVIAFSNVILQTLRGEYDSFESAMSSLQLLQAEVRNIEEQLLQSENQSQSAMHGTSNLISILPELLSGKNADFARRSICAEASRMFDRIIDDPQAPNAPANMAWALFLSLQQRHFDFPVLTAIQSGRETNIIGALCGAFCGARLGIKSIPANWISSLQARDLAQSRFDALINQTSAPLYELDLFDCEDSFNQVLDKGRKERFEKLEVEKRKAEDKKSKKTQPKAPPALPPTTYARRGLPGLPPVNPLLEDPEKARQIKEQRARKKIDWKEKRRQSKRRKDSH